MKEDPRPVPPPPAPLTGSLSVLYAFAGEERKSDIEEFLGRLAVEAGLELDFVALDILRSEGHDLLDEQLRDSLIEKVTMGAFDIVICTPPCNTFSRLPWSNGRGPRPLRSQQWPRGFPWLRGRNRIKIEEANIFVDFTWSLLFAAARRAPSDKQATIAMTEHPEDLGSTPRGLPASLWQSPEARQLVDEFGWTTVGVRQCDFGAPYPKPTRLLGNASALADLGVLGWPLHDGSGRYLGPIQQCKHNHRAVLVRRPGDASFPSKVLKSAAYPPAMCEAIAKALMAAFSTARAAVQAPPAEGGGRRDFSGSLPTRGRIEEQTSIGPNQVYIGRGNPRRALPRSPWANPHSIREAGGRDQAIRLFEKDLAGSPGLKARVKHLAGKQLLCHCPADLPCHADVLIAEAGRLEREEETSSEDEFGVRKPPRGAGWWGRGAPVLVYRGTVSRSMQDGGGLCSPGRWPPARRRLPPQGAELLPGLLQIARRASVPAGGPSALLCALATRKVSESPFALFGQEASELLEGILRSAGHVRSGRTPLPGEAIDLELLQLLLRWLGDPDAEGLQRYLKGVKVGVDYRMPRARSVYDRKVKWRNRLDPGEEPTPEKENYRSALDNISFLRKEFESQRAAGMFEVTTESEARKEYGDRLFVAALAAIEQGPDSFRIVHDGTHGVCVNNRIRVRDQTTSPLAQDVGAALECELEDATSPASLFALVWDISKAHRRLAVAREDWGFQACKVDSSSQEVWLNKVGTFGIGSISYWWNRLAAMIVRLVLMVFPPQTVRWVLCFADDVKLLLGGGDLPLCALGVLVLFQALRIPIKWSKVAGGFRVSWIGYAFDYGRFQIGLSEARASWLCKWIKERSATPVVVEEFVAVLGRLGFAFALSPVDRPFLGPLYAWASSRPLGSCTRLPLMARLVLTWMEHRLSRCPLRQVAPRPPAIPEVFRADAKAQGEEVVLGGWLSLNGLPTEEAPWYSVTLSRRTAPWAYARGEPFRAIAALELMASLLCLKLLVPLARDRGLEVPGGSLRLCGATDNKGNRHILDKHMTSKFPAVVVLMEIAAEEEAQDLVLDLHWVPRNQNEEADALTNHDFGDFRPQNRIACDFASVKWIVLETMMSAGMQLYSELDAAKAEAAAAAGAALKGGAGGRSRKRPLREADPW